MSIQRMQPVVASQPYPDQMPPLIEFSRVKVIASVLRQMPGCFSDVGVEKKKVEGGDPWAKDDISAYDPRMFPEDSYVCVPISVTSYVVEPRRQANGKPFVFFALIPYGWTLNGEPTDPNESPQFWFRRVGDGADLVTGPWVMDNPVVLGAPTDDC